MFPSRLSLSPIPPVKRTVALPVSPYLSLKFGTEAPVSGPKPPQTSFTQKVRTGLREGWQNINYRNAFIGTAIGLVVSIIPPFHFTLLALPICLGTYVAIDFIRGFIRGFRDG